MKNRIKKFLILFIIFPIHTSIGYPSEEILLSTIISNQVIELLNLGLEMERQAERYKNYLEIFDITENPLFQNLNEIQYAQEILLNQASSLISDISNGNIFDINQGLYNVAEIIQSTRESVLLWSNEMENEINKEIQKRKSEIEHSSSVIAQSQITNEALLAINEQLNALLSLNVEAQKLLAAEKSQEYLEEKKHRKEAIEKMEKFFSNDSQSQFSSHGKIQNNIFEKALHE